MKNIKILTAGIGTAMALTLIAGSTASADTGNGMGIMNHPASAIQASLHSRFLKGNGQVSGMAKVTHVSDDSVTAEDSKGRIWIINTNTEIDLPIYKIDVGDMISFTGILANGLSSAAGSNSYIVNATMIHDYGSISLASKARVSGTVTNVDDNNDQLTVDTDNGQTVTVDAANSKNFAKIEEGMTLHIKGFWNSLKNVIVAFKVRAM